MAHAALSGELEMASQVGHISNSFASHFYIRYRTTSGLAPMQHVSCLSLLYPLSGLGMMSCRTLKSISLGMRSTGKMYSGARLALWSVIGGKSDAWIAIVDRLLDQQTGGHGPPHLPRPACEAAA
ncbi:hypothetical protein SETIT_2G116800v2 [Setaria italica]|uniref:Uncharacterized protein n=1 Tax=Setaria italica TaxID=4555 RepID=A0A368PY16_SETIT|nr:hypothetical protein SETIT_2G116800v2 [Setaria italica]